MYSDAVRIFPYAALHIKAILRTFVCIWFRYKRCCKIICSAENYNIYSYFVKHI